LLGYILFSTIRDKYNIVKRKKKTFSTPYHIISFVDNEFSIEKID